MTLIVLLFFLSAGWPPPAVNEAHYLVKARHYWQPDWCAGDLFLASPDAHAVFYWTFGWPTRWLPLPVTAWLGRLAVWILQAWSWRRLSWAVVPRPLASLLTASLLLLFTQRFHMAGEWVVGGVEAKGVAFALVFFALERMLRARWNAAWLLLGGATAFHVLVGGWSLVAATVAWLSCGSLRPPLRSMLPAMLGAVILALLGLLPVLALNAGVPAETARQADAIYVYQRLSHHLVFHRFPHDAMARHAALLAIWLAACTATPCRLDLSRLGQRPLRGFVGGAILIALVGIAIDQSLLWHLDLAASLLRYYWYRLCDAFLPAGAALAAAGWVHANWDARPRIAAAVLGLLVLASGANLAGKQIEGWRDLRPQADALALPAAPGDPQQNWSIYEDWRAACAWIAAETPENSRFITPRRQQTFKWHAERSEVCCWKDIPQDARGLVAWWERYRELYPRSVIRGGLVMHGEQRLRELAEKYGAEFVVLDRTASDRPLLLPRVYPPDAAASSRYEVYRAR